MMEIELRDISHSDKEIETYLAIIEKIRNTTSEGVDRIREKAEKFFRQQNIVKTANEILRIAGNGDTDKYDACVGLLNDAMTQGLHNDFGEKPFDHINETLSDDYRIPIPTGIGKIDETLEGGLGKGELGVIIGPSGFGKSSMTTAMASHAACNGWKVLQIVFEDRIKQIQRKHLGRITGVEAKDLSKPDNIDLVKAAIENFPDKDKLNENLRIVKFPSGEKTARDIKRFIVKLTNSGFKPDLVIVDYFECLAHESSRDTSNEFEKEGKTMRIFEAMVGELNIAMWIPSQGTKDSINLELVTMDKIGGSVKKAQIAHIILSIARTVDDIANNKATIAILKNRAGKSGKVFNNVEFNNGTCRISTDNVSELDSLFELKQKQEETKLNIQKEVFLASKNDKK
jgi:archaellum biogenesis ATPase FlaH